jgi:hypothetical protein
MALAPRNPESDWVTFLYPLNFVFYCFDIRLYSIVMGFATYFHSALLAAFTSPLCLNFYVTLLSNAISL